MNFIKYIIISSLFLKLPEKVLPISLDNQNLIKQNEHKHKKHIDNEYINETKIPIYNENVISYNFNSYYDYDTSYYIISYNFNRRTRYIL
jgi:hypothetical protein